MVSLNFTLFNMASANMRPHIAEVSSYASLSVRPTGAAGSFPYTERHLKCVWFSPVWRPAELRTTRGEPVIVEKAGRWNLEKGPDFLDAALLVGQERRRITGDVEVHIHQTDWQKHGHGSDPAYARVIAHVCFFPGHIPVQSLPEGALQIALKNSLVSNPFFSFESIDVTAYPFAARASKTPCSKIISGWSPEAIASLITAAGKYRLSRKAECLVATIANKGADQVLFEETMSALGYKHNRAPFRQLAERVPLEVLREDAQGEPLAAYALLSGVAGLLPAVTKSCWDDETRRFVRQLWSYWWKLQARWSPRIMAAESWNLSSVRPQNHPRRRLMAAAVFFTAKRSLSGKIEDLKTGHAAEWMEQIIGIFENVADNYWSYRLAMGRKPSANKMALIGRQRAAAIVSNVVIPFLAALRQPTLPQDSLFNNLPAEEDNIIIRQAALNLLGPDHNPAFYRNGLLQQGLIQIFHDFCLGDRSDCRACGLLAGISRSGSKGLRFAERRNILPRKKAR